MSSDEPPSPTAVTVPPELEECLRTYPELVRVWGHMTRESVERELMRSPHEEVTFVMIDSALGAMVLLNQKSLDIDLSIFDWECYKVPNEAVDWGLNELDTKVFTPVTEARAAGVDVSGAISELAAEGCRVQTQMLAQLREAPLARYRRQQAEERRARQRREEEVRVREQARQRKEEEERALQVRIEQIQREREERIRRVREARAQQAEEEEILRRMPTRTPEEEEMLRQAEMFPIGVAQRPFTSYNGMELVGVQPPSSEHARWYGDTYGSITYRGVRLGFTAGGAINGRMPQGEVTLTARGPEVASSDNGVHPRAIPLARAVAAMQGREMNHVGGQSNDNSTGITCPAEWPGEPAGLTEEGTCVVCMERRPATAIVPCGHVCLCVHCSRALARGDAADRKCPHCRVSIQQIIRVYGDVK